MTRTRRTVAGLALVVAGALLGMLAMTALPWYRSTLGGFLAFGTKVSDLRQTISFYRSAPDVYGVISYGVSPAYFGWLAIAVLLAAALLGAATIGLDERASRIAGLVAAAAGVGGVVLTALAIRVVGIDAARLQRAIGTRSNPPGYTDFLAATSIGAWTMTAAFLAVAVGALLASGGRDAMRELLADESDPDEPDPGPSTDAVPDPPRETW